MKKTKSLYKLIICAIAMLLMLPFMIRPRIAMAAWHKNTGSAVTNSQTNLKVIVNGVTKTFNVKNKDNVQYAANRAKGKYTVTATGSTTYIANISATNYTSWAESGSTDYAYVDVPIKLTIPAKYYFSGTSTDYCNTSNADHTGSHRFRIAAANQNQGSRYSETKANAGTSARTVTVYFSFNTAAADIHRPKNIYWNDSDPQITITLTAVAEHTVTYNANGGSNGPAAQTVMEDHSYTVSTSSPSRAGYTFSGWYTTASGGTKVSGSKTMGTSNVTYYAHWTANTYTVTLNQQSGSGGTGSVTATYGSGMPAITKPSRTGYTFGGYYTSTGGGGTQYYTNTGASARNWDKTAATTLYAKWTANTYTVTLNQQSGSGGTGSVTATYGSAMPSMTKPSRTGYTFGGYYTGTGGTGTQYYTNAGASTRNWNIASATTLYAKWTANTYTVAYNGNGSTSGSTTSSTHTYDTAKNLTANGFRKTGYAFNGWNTQANGSGTSYTNSQSVKNLATSGTVTLYAQWRPLETLITYNANGGSIPANASFTNSNGTYKWRVSNGVVQQSLNNGAWTNAQTKATYNNVINLWNVESFKLAKTGYRTVANMAYGLNANGNGTKFNQDTSSATDTNAATYSTVNPTTPTADNNVQIYVNWIPNTYTITYHGNGNEGGDTAASSHTYDKAKQLTPNGFTKTGYDFIGWNTNTVGTGTSYNNEESVINLTATNGKNIDLYAQWGAIGYYVKYNANGGSGHMPNSRYTFNEAGTLAANTYLRGGYSFTGWNTEPDGSGTDFGNRDEVYNLLSEENAVFELYAQWTDAPATVTESAPKNYKIDSKTKPLIFDDDTGYYEGELINELDTNELVITKESVSEEEGSFNVHLFVKFPEGSLAPNDWTPDDVWSKEAGEWVKNTGNRWTKVKADSNTRHFVCTLNVNAANSWSDSITVKNLPVGTEYTVSEEQGTPGWFLVGETDTSGKISGSSPSHAIITNEYRPNEMHIYANKTLLMGAEQVPVTAGQFTFNLLDEDDNIVKTATNDANGLVDFYFNRDDLSGYSDGDELSFSIEEVKDASQTDIVKWDEGAYYVDVTINEDDHGSKTCLVEYDTETMTPPDLMNIKREPGAGKLQIVKNTSENRAGTFKFYVMLSPVYLVDNLTTLGPGWEDEDGGLWSYTMTVDSSGTNNVITADIPAGVSYSITEEEQAFWTAESENSSGEIEANKTAVAIFNNTYAPTPFIVEAFKFFNGGAIEENQFKFQLLDENNAVKGEAFAETDGSVHFPPIEFSDADVGTHTWHIKEVIGSVQGVLYDSHVEDVTINVRKNEYNDFVAEATYDEDGATFENIKKAKLTIKKETVDDIPGDFTLNLALTYPAGYTPAAGWVPGSGWTYDSTSELWKKDIQVGNTGETTVEVELPSGTEYVLTETYPDVWAQVEEECSNLENTMTEDQTAILTNRLLERDVYPVRLFAGGNGIKWILILMLSFTAILSCVLIWNNSRKA